MPFKYKWTRSSKSTMSHQILPTDNKYIMEAKVDPTDSVRPTNQKQYADSTHKDKKQSWPSPIRLAVWVCGLILLGGLYKQYSTVPELAPPATDMVSQACKQAPVLRPSHGLKELDDMDEYIASKSFREASIRRLSGAVQIPTESFDNMGPVGEDERWEIMYDFATYLEKTFPLIHANLKLEKVNTHGLLYTWQGSKPELKPTLLMAHYDVVPVPEDTVNAWKHPPFSGFFDGKFIWGRGSWDDKNQLIGIMEAVEELLRAGYVPNRTVLMPFGFDEEISGPNGAAHLAPFILERYGKDGIAAIVDEGSLFGKQWGMKIALPAVGEKGYTDVHITIRMPGGHSSIPPDHTSIGVMSELITLVEADQYPTFLEPVNPLLGLLTCGAEHGPSFPPKIKKLLHDHPKQSRSLSSSHPKKDKLALAVAKEGGPAIRYLMQTSIAADVISGGVKNNALPERTTATINHRINIGEHVNTVHSKLTQHAAHIAKKYNLTLHAFDYNGPETPRSLTLSSGQTLEPAPVSPIDSKAWAVLAGTTRALYGNDTIVAPGLMTGNTDTKYYWDLTRHIYRFSPGWDDEIVGLGNIHTVNEHMSAKAHIKMVRWMSLFVRNMDEAELD